MPRTNDPLGIFSGAGLAPPGSVSPSSISPGEAGSGPSLAAHVTNPVGAHRASAISIEDPFQRYFMGPNVEGALNELASLVPPAMGAVGSPGVPWLGSLNLGVPDWGILKLHDGVTTFTGNPSANPYAVYPYYYRAPVSYTGSGPTAQGMDRVTDPMFNIADGVYTGGGPGLAHAAFVSIPMGGPVTGFPTWRLIEAKTDPALVVSGIVSPADRGVLALVKWSTGTEPKPSGPAITVADIQKRCVAALLLGKGILGSGGCDGDPGGIFTEGSGSIRASGGIKFINNPAAGYTITLDLSALPGGPPLPVVFTAVALAPTNAYEFKVGGSNVATAENFAYALNSLFFPTLLVARVVGFDVFVDIAALGTVGNAVVFSTTALPADITVTSPFGGVDAPANPFNFPGRASGQYNLDEIHTGTSLTSSPNPFMNPAAGQVRLLTDPAAVTFPAPRTVAGGIPIFGGTTNAVGPITPLPGFPFGIGGGTDGNFFAYRLPYLKDYVSPTGLIYTPDGDKPRFYNKLLPALGGFGTMPKAGNYDNFTENFWAYQLGRYRHRVVLNTGVGIYRLDDSYALVHFKKEEYFEKYVRDGVAPANDQVYSINLVSWTGNTSPFNTLLNLTNTSIPPSASVASDVNRTEIVEDDQGTTPLVYAGLSYDLGDNGAPTTAYTSGVPYLVPLDVTQPLPGTPNVGIKGLDFDVSFPFQHGYRSHDKVPVAGPLSGDNRAYALNQNLAFVSLSSFSYQGDELTGTSTISAGSPLFPASLGQIRRQRIEFGYADLTSPVTDSPAPGDHAIYSFASVYTTGITFLGDDKEPSFTQDAKVRLFFRRPLVVDGNGFPIPDSGVEIPRLGGLKTLFHSMLEASDTVAVGYGNPSVFAKRGVSPTKDKSERFLDEVYRYPDNWTPLLAPDQLRLQGPGMVFAPAPILVPVRPTGVPGYTGWLGLVYHVLALDNVTPGLSTALQVAGLPERNPSYLEGLTSPFPSRGILQYPKTDYSVGYNPTGPDYSLLTGDRTYVRAFDAGIANAGQASVKFRLWGLELANFQYTGGATPGSPDMAVMVKVPGLTTWMDAGRTDGTGPGKQDVANDGAGCLLFASEGVDAPSQLKYTDITVNTGPGFLFDNGLAMCPVLVKVIIRPTGTSLDFTQGGPTGPTSACRGLVGIDVL